MARRRNAWLTPDSNAQSGWVARCLSIPEPLFPMVTGALSLLTEAWRWEQFGTMSPEDAAELATQMLENFGNQECDTMLLRQNPDNPCELQTSINGIDWSTWADMALCAAAAQIPGRAQPQTVRKNPTTGELEFSLDGGTTWTDYPEPSQPQPPYIPPRIIASEGTDHAARCAAASRVVGNLAAMYQQTYGAITAGIHNTLTGFTQFLTELNDTLAGIVWGSWYEAASAAIDVFFGTPYWTYYDAPTLPSSAQDALLCLVYFNAEVVDGVVILDFNAIRNNVISELGLNPGTAVWTHLNYLGEDGLNRLADVGFGSSEICGDCIPTECSFSVSARAVYNSTVAAVAGDVFNFTVTGTWSVNGSQYISPNADTGYYNSTPTDRIPSQPSGAGWLVFRPGNSGTWFRAKTGVPVTIPAGRSGNLQFAINDGGWSDNQGSVAVVVNGGEDCEF